MHVCVQMYVFIIFVYLNCYLKKNHKLYFKYLKMALVIATQETNKPYYNKQKEKKEKKEGQQ